MGTQIATIVMSFICRTVFISTLGKTYLGVTSLFTNILSMLSLADLGIGTAITYYMYEPLSQNDQHRVVILMDFYKKAYMLIAGVIAVIGVGLIPFLPVLIKDYDTMETLGLNGVLIYLLFLSKSVSTYLFFAHRSVIIRADQHQYIIEFVETCAIIAQDILQIVSLVLWGDFITYVLIQIACVVIKNIITASIAKKQYPYINQKPDEKIAKSEIKNIFKDCGSVFVYRINRVILKSTDNIVLSASLGLSAVAQYSNYYVFYTVISGFYTKINVALIHSIGNLHVNNDLEHEHKIFKALFLAMIIVGGTAGVGIAVCSDELISTWLGESWIIEQPFSIMMGIELFFLCLQYFLSKYRNAVGLFQQMKFFPILGSVTNIAASLILVKLMGISGVILGTIIAEAIVFMVIDPRIIYKYGFKSNFKLTSFYANLTLQTGVLVVAFFICRFLCGYFIGYGWFSVIAHVIICGVVTPGLIVLVNIRKKETQYLLNVMLGRMVKKIRHKILPQSVIK